MDSESANTILNVTIMISHINSQETSSLHPQFLQCCNVQGFRPSQEPNSHTKGIYELLDSNHTQNKTKRRTRDTEVDKKKGNLSFSYI